MIPATERRPGVYQEFYIDNRGTVAFVAVRLCVVAIKSAAGTATPGVAVQVLDEDAADTLAGRGSQAALMLRAAFQQIQRAGGGGPELWLNAMAAPSSGATAATQTFTVTTTTVLAGEVVFKIAGRPLVASVAAGASATQIASSMKEAIDAAVKILPVTGAAVAGVVTCTAVHTGVHGNDIAYQVVSTPSGVSVATAVGVAGAGAVDVTTTLDAMLDRDYDAIALGNHTATDVSDAVAHNAAAWGYEQQRYRHVILGERGTLATANGLATPANNKTVVIVGCEGCPNLPGEMAAAFAAATWSKVKDDGTTSPNANLDGEVLYLYPPQSADAFTSAEQNSALASGVTPLIPTDDGQAVTIVRAVTTKTLTNGAFDESEFDLAFSRTQAYIARENNLSIKANHKQQVRDASLLTRIRDTVLAVQRRAAASNPPVLVGVEQIKDEITATYATAPSGRVVVENPFIVASPHHQTVVKNRQLISLPKV